MKLSIYINNWFIQCYFYLPTTIISPWSDTVWNDGASAETSQR